MNRAEIKAPTRIEICCFQGVAPTRKPVFRSCEVVPPFDDAMQTIPAIESAVIRYSGPTQPSNTKIRHVSKSVAIVMPEIGLDDEPITPVIRELTVTNTKPNNTIMPRADQPAGRSVGIRCDAATASTRPSVPDQHKWHRQVAIRSSHVARITLLPRPQVAKAAAHRRQ